MILIEENDDLEEEKDLVPYFLITANQLKLFPLFQLF